MPIIGVHVPYHAILHETNCVQPVTGPGPSLATGALDAVFPFSQIAVDFAVRGVTRVTWFLQSSYIGTTPLIFQLQVSTDSGSPDSWVDIGPPVVNQFFALDSSTRAYGNLVRVVYRVKLLTANAVFISGNGFCFGLLSYRQWLEAKAIVRRVILMPRGLVHHRGYLLKRKVHGERCTCVDRTTGAITNSNHAVCGGTGIVRGYWRAAENIMFDLSPEVDTNLVDPELSRQTINDVEKECKCLGLPPIASNDVWASKQTGKRYYIESVQNTGEINEVPITVTAKLHLAPFSDVIYTVPLEGD